MQGGVSTYIYIYTYNEDLGYQRYVVKSPLT